LACNAVLAVVASYGRQFDIFPVATKWSIFIGVILVLAAGTVGAVALRVRHGEPSAEIEDSARYGYTLVGLGYVLLLVATLNIVAFGGFAQSGSLEFILPEKDGVAGRSSGVRTRKYIRQSARSKASMTEGAMATLRVSLAPYLLCSVKLLGQGAPKFQGQHEPHMTRRSPGLRSASNGDLGSLPKVRGLCRNGTSEVPPGGARAAGHQSGLIALFSAWPQDPSNTPQTLQWAQEDQRSAVSPATGMGRFGLMRIKGEAKGIQPRIKRRHDSKIPP
jgi:hypothetical protein